MTTFEKFEIILNKEDYNTIQRLNHALKQSGITFSISPFQSDPDRFHLFICINQESTHNKVGRKLDITNLSDKAHYITCGELLNLQVKLTNEEIIQLLGCSRRTFYRYLKKAKQATDPNQLFFS